MARLPVVVGLVLCETLAVEPQSARMSLVGTFHNRYFRRFPTPPQRFTAYAALDGGMGEGTIELRVTRLETEQEILRYRKWYAFSDPDLTANLEIKLRKCVFPAPGRYGLSLRFDGDELTYRHLDVFRIKG
jgi:hypothetical protein